LCYIAGLMNGVHDLGGMDGLGPIEVETDEPVFHQVWEGRVFGVIAALAAHRLYRTDSFRHAIERMDPAHYLTSPYYEHWLTGVATLLVENGVVTRAELESKADGRFPLAQPVHPGVPPASSPSGPQSRFAVGDAVIVRNLHPFGHTRCPRYIRGKRGVVTRVDERSQLPDVAAPHRCEQYAYNVRFDGTELWGEHASRATAVHVDLWESYLEAL
jgi:nitrile hydratase beta subunit